MDVIIEDGPGGVLVANLAAGESLLAAADALVDHSGGVRVERARDGVVRQVTNAEQQRQRTPVRVTATRDATVRLGPTHHGGIVAAPLDDGDIAATRDAFVAAHSTTRLGADRVGNAPSRGNGLFLTTLAGEGAAYLAGRGTVDPVTVPDGDEHVVAIGNVVGFDADADVSVERVGPVEDAPPVCRFRGPTTVWVASRPASTPGP